MTTTGSRKRIKLVLLVAGLAVVSAATLAALETRQPHLLDSRQARTNQSDTESVVSREPSIQTSPKEVASTQSEHFTSDTNAKNESHTSVIINGESIPVPDNGRIHKTYTNHNNESSVDIDIRTETSAN